MRRFFAVSAMSIVAFAAASPALAQDATAQPDTPGESVNQGGDDVQIVVTGSRIARQDYVSASPILTTGEEAIQNTGAVNIESALNQLPQF